LGASLGKVTGGEWTSSDSERGCSCKLRGSLAVSEVREDGSAPRYALTRLTPEPRLWEDPRQMGAATYICSMAP